MLFHDFLEALLRSWGREPKGTTVWQLLKEVLQNLPFGVKTEMVEIVPRQSVTKTSSLGGTCISSAVDVELFVGKKYKVNLNGVYYDAEAKEGPADDMIVCGNELFVGGDVDTGEPFAIINIPGNKNMIWLAELGETITFALYGEGEVVKPIDIKYLPIEELKQALGIGGPV